MPIGGIANQAINTSIQQNARRALDAGMINPRDFQAMTDGRVSHADLRQAQNLVYEARQSGNQGQLQIAQNLEQAISAKLDGQGTLRTLGEDARDAGRHARESFRGIRG